MANFLEYNPEQAYLLPPTVRAVLGEGHLCFFVHGAVEKLDLQELEASYSDEGHPAYHPALLLKVWLYAYALGMTSSRRLEQRIREDLAFRYLAGGAQPDFWTLNEFRKRHGRALNDNGLLIPMVDKVPRECGQPPGQVSADSGFFSLYNLEVLEARGIDGYVPDSNLAGVLHQGGILKQATRHAALLRMRSKLTSTTGRALYRRRKAVAEPVIGILKEQRGMRRFRMRGLRKVAVEFALATTALNPTRMWRLRPPGQRFA